MVGSFTLGSGYIAVTINYQCLYPQTLNQYHTYTGLLLEILKAIISQHLEQAI